MYAYVWNPNTGGFRLTTEKLLVSKEPRPVYARELDILGFDKYFKYDSQKDVPYMWAEANNYWYRGRQIAKTVGGSLYTPPKLEILDADGIETLQPVDIDAMVAENAEIFKALVQATIKKIYDTYKRYRNKVEVFFVSYSGGKDSEVTLDLVQRAIPHSDFIVIFSDTGMEFPDTYNSVRHVQNKCNEWKIDFYIARSHFTPEESWTLFGPPSNTMRWCCSVHKTAPQILKLREIVGKSSFKEMAFIGVRADESQKRSGYEYISYGKKHNGQFSCYPILNWNSAEVFLYLYTYNININNAYKLGNSRAGCLVCPMSGDKSDSMRYLNYKEQIDKYINLIKKSNIRTFQDNNDMMNFYDIGGWKQRKNGRDLRISPKFEENSYESKIKLSIKTPITEWKEWSKTVGHLINISKNNYQIAIEDKIINFDILDTKEGYDVLFDVDKTINNSAISKFKNIFRKSASCVLCQECEAECQTGALVMKNGKLVINDKCIQCGNCHKPELGCILYKSLVLPKGDNMAKTGIDCYQDHAPRIEWFEAFFSNPQEFLLNNTLGSGMIKSFRKFLTDVLIIPERSKDKSKITEIGELLIFIGLSSNITWGIMLVNGSYSTVLNWFVKNVKTNLLYSVDMLNDAILAEYPKTRKNRVPRVYKQFCSLPFGTKLGLGKVTEEGKETYFTRGTWIDPEPLVILYALYKFAIACGDYYEFTLTRLLDHEIDSDGVSPTEIFNLDRETMVPILKGLAINYPEFISVTFTHDLDAISLNREKAPIDVLKLIAEG